VALRMSPEREPSADAALGAGSGAGPRTPGPFCVSSLMVDRTAVLSLSGRVDLGALPACRREVDALLREGVTEITVDLQVAHFDDESIALLALMRRYAARHGARLMLADIPAQVARVLDRTGVAWLYRPDGPFPTTPARPEPDQTPANRSVSRPSPSRGPAGSPRTSR
jgi:anti-anti-sigma factor